jgi:hypothetical protein
VVPQNKSYHLKPVTFSGPCKSNFTFKVIWLRSLHACIYTSLYIHIHIRQLTYILLIVCLILKVFVFLSLISLCRSMEQSKLLLINQIIKNINDNGLCSKIFKILLSKVRAPSMAMGRGGGITHAKSTNLWYIYIYICNSAYEFFHQLSLCPSLN